jgi:hypothetical protein
VVKHLMGELAAANTRADKAEAEAVDFQAQITECQFQAAQQHSRQATQVCSLIISLFHYQSHPPLTAHQPHPQSLRSRCAVDVTGDGPADAQPSCYYEVRGKSRKEISHLCRLGLDYRYPQQVAPGAGAGAGAGAGTCTGAGAGTGTGAGARGAHSLAAFFPPR